MFFLLPPPPPAEYGTGSQIPPSSSPEFHNRTQYRPVKRLIKKVKKSPKHTGRKYFEHGTALDELVSTAFASSKEGDSCRESGLPAANSNFGNTPRKTIPREPGHEFVTRPYAPEAPNCCCSPGPATVNNTGGLPVCQARSVKEDNPGLIAGTPTIRCSPGSPPDLLWMSCC